MRIYAVIVSAVLSLVCLFTLQSGISHAGVFGSKHDLSNSGGSNFQFQAGSASDGSDDQVCVFCHTPHRANTNVKTMTVYNVAGAGSYDTSSGTPLLLWNRALANAGASSWQLYESGTMTPTGGQLDGPDVVGVYSLMCLSCHDGIMAMNQLTSPPAGTTNPLTVVSGYDQIGDLYPGSACDPSNPAAPCTNIGERIPGGSEIMRLDNDHPVTIDYVAAYSNESGLKAITDVDSSIRFFPDPYGSSQTVRRFVECSSCHNPHVYGDDFEKTTPFLVMTREYSALCRACHLK